MASAQQLLRTTGSVFSGAGAVALRQEDRVPLSRGGWRHLVDDMRMACGSDETQWFWPQAHLWPLSLQGICGSAGHQGPPISQAVQAAIAARESAARAIRRQMANSAAAAVPMIRGTKRPQSAELHRQVAILLAAMATPPSS
ncbi:hypothetical protein NDU88_010360 [Pleurodeles waltl]|uniref:Uncharacterized protein n=1 Tax=Pleurodeles waltl TaxID=8319 RepID=A0AAV7PVG6_PLEWA|nr:hypothetical protein NDU88_010360 [Pleurodeles waltl]